ncbi:MAG: peptide-methionine (S)-S-oxide reductase MsrA [Saprospiraceae bacterium]|nr:peptide-methionine (S)-S-oxide reductase MsrA [Saprospiraceae bacterium]
MLKKKIYLSLLSAIVCFVMEANSCNQPSHIAESAPYVPAAGLSKAYFASGCFWCVEAIYESVYGVEEVISGYSGGEAADANYEAVSSGSTNHAEAVEIYYDANKVSFETLLKVFFDSHDPTTYHQQGPDAGSQYRSSIFYQNENEKKAADAYIAYLYGIKAFPAGSITTEVVPFISFYPAEPYHQNYEKLNPNQPYVKSVSVPRLKKFQAKNQELLKKETPKH